MNVEELFDALLFADPGTHSDHPRVVINHPTTGLHNIGGINAETHDGETVIVIHVLESE